MIISQGRTFDGHVMDMIEFGVDDYTALTELRGPKKAVGSKPLFVFNGSQWESDTLYTRIQNLLLDFFRGAKLEMMSLQGIDHVIVCTVIDGKIYLRVHSISFRKSGSRVPDVVLVPMGPFLNMTVRRTQLASEDMWKASMRQPKNAAPPKVKNVSNTTLGEKMGRIHMKKQNLDKMGGRRMTALRSSGKGAKQAEAVAEAAAGKPTGKKASKRANDEYNSEFQEEKPKKQKLVDIMI
jgi:ribosome production factor 2